MIALFFATVVALSYNEAGGRIALTDNYGDCRDGEMMAISNRPNGEYYTGCWSFSGGMVFVTWADGQKRIYDSGIFELSTEAKRGEIK